MARLRFKIKEVIEILEYSQSPSKRIELLNKYGLKADMLHSIRDALIRGRWRVLG
jgi:hypothetical protein